MRGSLTNRTLAARPRLSAIQWPIRRMAAVLGKLNLERKDGQASVEYRSHCLGRSHGLQLKPRYGFNSRLIHHLVCIDAEASSTPVTSARVQPFTESPFLAGARSSSTKC